MISTEIFPLRTGDLANRAAYRPLCHRCWRPRIACYCRLIEAFDSEPRFVILTQPREAKHPFGTGRMAHLCLSNSLLIEGVDFSADDRVNREIHGSGNFAVLLYPSADSLNLSRLTTSERMRSVPSDRRLVVFVLDGTWKSARKMIRLSRNLASLPRIRFHPPIPSSYRIRRQPKPYCYSTIEAIHHVMELFALPGSSRRLHDNLLIVFHSVIARQLTYPS